MFETLQTINENLNLQHSLQDSLLIFMLILARMIAIINMVPFLGSKNAPPQLKMSLAILFSLLFWPYVATLASVKSFGFLGFSLLFLKEIFVGFTIGFVTAQIFFTVEMMGQIIDVVRGTNQAQLLVPELQERSSAIGDFNYQLVLILFLTLGLHVIFFNVLAESFIRIPILSFNSDFTDPSTAINYFSSLLSNIFMIAASLAFPIALVCFLSDVAFGLLNRVAPQINAYFMSMPAKAAGGMIIFLAAFSMISDQFIVHARDFLDSLPPLLEILR